LKPNFISPLLKPGAPRFVLRNQRNGEVLATHIAAAVDSAARRKGLLGRTQFSVGDGLIIAPCNAIHTFFMKFTIDVAFVCRDGIVVRTIDCLPPWRIGSGLWAWATIELPEGVLAETDTRKGDCLALEPQA
jgi:uncharacterized protein